MYTTSFGLILGGIPGTIGAAFLLRFGPDHIDRSVALLLGGYMIAAEVVIAVILFYSAQRISKRKRKICTENDDADA